MNLVRDLLVHRLLIYWYYLCTNWFMTQELLAVAYCTYIWSCHWRKISFLQMSAEKCLLQFCLQSSYGLNINNSILKMKYITLRNAEPISQETLMSVHMCFWKIVLQVVVHSKLDLLAWLQYLLSRDVILIFFPTDDE